MNDPKNDGTLTELSIDLNRFERELENQGEIGLIQVSTVMGMLRNKTKQSKRAETTPNKKRPTGFVAVCQCGQVVGALDWDRTDRATAGKLLGKWLAEGCIVSPQFESCWETRIEACVCEK